MWFGPHNKITLVINTDEAKWRPPWGPSLHPNCAGSRHRHDVRDMDGFVAAVVSRAAVADGNAPVVAATAAAVRAASPRKFTSLSPSLFLLLFLALQKKQKQSKQRNFQQKHRSGSLVKNKLRYFHICISIWLSIVINIEIWFSSFNEPSTMSTVWSRSLVSSMSLFNV